jgi:hypothetical protein
VARAAGARVAVAVFAWFERRDEAVRAAPLPSGASARLHRPELRSRAADVHHRRSKVKQFRDSTTLANLCWPISRREDFLYDFKGGSLRSPPAPPAAGGRKRPSSPRRTSRVRGGPRDRSDLRHPQRTTPRRRRLKPRRRRDQLPGAR